MEFGYNWPYGFSGEAFENVKRMKKPAYPICSHKALSLGELKC